MLKETWNTVTFKHQVLALHLRKHGLSQNFHCRRNSDFRHVFTATIGLGTSLLSRAASNTIHWGIKAEMKEYLAAFERQSKFGSSCHGYSTVLS